MTKKSARLVRNVSTNHSARLQFKVTYRSFRFKSALQRFVRSLALYAVGTKVCKRFKIEKRSLQFSP